VHRRAAGCLPHRDPSDGAAEPGSAADERRPVGQHAYRPSQDGLQLVTAGVESEALLQVSGDGSHVTWSGVKTLGSCAVTVDMSHKKTKRTMQQWPCHIVSSRYCQSAHSTSDVGLRRCTVLVDSHPAANALAQTCKRLLASRLNGITLNKTVAFWLFRVYQFSDILSS